jgi:cell wall-associated NlpC family hydrolase
VVERGGLNDPPLGGAHCCRRLQTFFCELRQRGASPHAGRISLRSGTIQARLPIMIAMVPAHHMIHRALLPMLLSVAALITGCASAPPQSHQPYAGGQAVAIPRPAEMSIGGAIAELAMGMVGTRYRYGGTDPREDFDCSGLVFYAYNKAGYAVPRTSQEQFRVARKIALGEAGAGDLMFFQDQTKLSHVGIYLGDGLFVHAPATGQHVAVANINSPYYQRHLIAVGRLLAK